jgi:hypothetical protein
MPGFNGGWKKVMGMSQLAEGFNSSDLEQFAWIGKYYDIMTLKLSGCYQLELQMWPFLLQIG